MLADRDCCGTEAKPKLFMENLRVPGPRSGTANAGRRPARNTLVF
jgi:hypothetical protein